MEEVKHISRHLQCSFHHVLREANDLLMALLGEDFHLDPSVVSLYFARHCSLLSCDCELF